MEKILAITGAGGKKSGGEFIKVISDNIRVVSSEFSSGIRLLVRNSSNANGVKNLIPNSEVFAGDLNEKSFLQDALEGVDTLVHIAGIHMSPNVVSTAVECGVRRMILVHTTGIYSKYKAAGAGYLKIEEQVYRLCKENDVKLTICRPTMIYGNIYDNNVVTFVKMVDKLPVMPVVNGARYNLQPVHYKDLAKAYFDILMNEEKTANKDYVLSGGSVIELREMLKIIGNNLGKKVRFVTCPFVIAYLGAWAIYCLSIGKIDYREKVQRLCEPRAYSYDEAKHDFGYSPVSFQEGIVDEVKQYMKEKV